MGHKLVSRIDWPHKLKKTVPKERLTMLELKSFYYKRYAPNPIKRRGLFWNIFSAFALFSGATV